MAYFLFFILFILLIGIVLLGGVLRFLGSIFRIRRKDDFQSSSSKKDFIYTNEAENKQKIFDSDEGEYVEFEEIDEDGGKPKT